MPIALTILACVYAGVQLLGGPGQDDDVGARDDEDVDASPEDGLVPRKRPRSIALSTASLALAIVSRNSRILQLISAGVISYTLMPIIDRAEQKWRIKPRVSNDMLFSAFGALAVVTGHNWAIAFSIWAYEVGTELLHRTDARARKLALDSFGQLPRTAWLRRDGAEIEVPLAELEQGDVVVVDAGEIVPVDGRVIDGYASIDQQLLTGEAQPADKQPGSRVMASTRVASGRISVRVEKIGLSTHVAQIGQMLTEAANYKTSVQSKGERWADEAAAPTLLVAGLTVPVLGLTAAMVVLNSSFGNRVRVLTPLGTLNYLNIASRRGVLVKGGSALEQANRVDTVLFDKTGTLTHLQSSPISR
ncbi:MAG: HAD-IC family P-type ATPase [Myxococcota bacterium]